MRKLGTFITTLGLLNVLALAGLVAFVVATGRLDQAKATVMLDLLRHPGTPEKLRENVADLLEPKPAATAPASGPATQSELARLRSEFDHANVASAQDRIDKVNQAIRAEALRLEDKEQSLRKLQDLLDKQRDELAKRYQALDEARAALDKQVKAQNTRLKDEAFAKSLTLYNDLKPKQVKDIFLTLSPDTVADFLRAMEAERATRIIGEFKTDDEKKFIAGVLEKIRAGGTAPALGSDGAPATLPAGSAQARST